MLTKFHFEVKNAPAGIEVARLIVDAEPDDYETAKATAIYLLNETCIKHSIEPPERWIIRLNS